MFSNLIKYPNVSCINTSEEELIAVCVDKAYDTVQKSNRTALSFSFGSFFNRAGIGVDLFCSKLYKRIETFYMMKGYDHRQCLSLQTFFQMFQVPLEVVLPLIACTISMHLKGFYLSCYLPQLL